MSFYVLDVVKSGWDKEEVVIQDADPYRAVWQNPESGAKICSMFIGIIIRSDQSWGDEFSTRLGFHFYKYESPFDFNKTSPAKRPKMVSNIYFPSKTKKNMKVDKIVGYALSQLETLNNGSEIKTFEDSFDDDQRKTSPKE